MSDRTVEKIKTHFMSNKSHPLPSPPENRSAYEKMWENTVDKDRPQMIVQYKACAVRAGCLRQQIHTQNG